MKEKIIENLILFWGLALIALFAWEFNIPPTGESTPVYWLLYAIVLMLVGPYFTGKLDKNLGWIFENEKRTLYFARVGLVVPFFVIVYIVLEVMRLN